MARISFDNTQGIIILRLTVGGIDANASQAVPVALDTGATFTTISPKVAVDLGYDLSYPNQEVKFFTANSTVSAPIITVRQLTAIGETVDNIDVLCHDLPEGSIVEGLLGLNFLAHFDISISFSTGTIELRPR